MTVLFVDTEHERVLRDPAHGVARGARMERARRRLAAAAGAPCVVVRFGDLSPARVRALAPAAIVLSGSTTDWPEYDFRALEGLLDTIRAAPLPLLGICAGHQLIGYAHGARWGPLAPLEPGEADPDPTFAPGRRKERGYLDVQLDGRCPVFRGLGPRARFFQSHSWQLLDAPAGFVARASSACSPIQTIERRDRPVFGVQFHPERYDAEHPAGQALLRNFFALARDR